MGVVAQRTKLWHGMPTSHFRVPVHFLGILLLVQPLTGVTWWAACDDSNEWTPATCLRD